ncbi:MAG TPA: rhomboid family intramembrane serine protease [Myxococcales bacterium]|nr:rhomboid family intramembrane serine protease [Myxococcales bacterium]
MTDPLGGLPEQGELPQPDEGAARPRARRRQETPPRPTTWAILIVLAVAFAAELAVGQNWKGEDTVTLFRLGALFGPAVRDGDWWRIGAYAFLHIGWLHIAMNAYALWVLAPQLEWTFGSNLTLGFFAATALAGGAASTAWGFFSHQPHLAAGASGGLFGLFGATIGLYLRVRHSLPEPVRRGIVRAIAINVLLNVAIAVTAPVDSAAHAGGLVSGLLLSLVAPLPRLERRPWHPLTKGLLVACALGLAAMEGAAVARAVRPGARTLRGNGAEAQVSGLFVPVEPGIAELPGVAKIGIAREAEPIAIVSGEDAVHIGAHTWLRRRTTAEGDSDLLRLVAADGGGRLVIEFLCRDAFCRGARGDALVELTARTIH